MAVPRGARGRVQRRSYDREGARFQPERRLAQPNANTNLSSAMGHLRADHRFHFIGCATGNLNVRAVWPHAMRVRP